MNSDSEPPASSASGTALLHRSPTSTTPAHWRALAWTFLDSAGFVALVAVVETLVATALLGVPLSPAPAVVGLVAFAVYATDHAADAEADAVSNPDRAAAAERHADLLAAGAAVAYGLAVALSLAGGPLAVAITLLPGCFWIGYASGWLPTAGDALPGLADRVPRLKEVLVVNSAVVALAWAIAVTFLPLAFATGGFDGPPALGRVLTPVAGVVFAYFLLRSFVDVEVPNVRDVRADRAAGVATLPTAFGVHRTRRALYLVDLCVLGLVTTAGAAGLLTLGQVAALLAGLAVSVGVTSLVGRVDAGRAFGVAPECSYFAVAAALLSLA